MRIRNPLWSFLKSPYPVPSKDWLKYYIPGKEIKDLKNIIRKNKEYFFPEENKTSNHMLEPSDFINKSKITEELKKIFHKKWIHDLFGKDQKEKLKTYIKTLVNIGYQREEAKSILTYATKNVERIKHWSYDNEIVGKRASNLMSLAIPFGIIRNLIYDLDFIPSFFKRITNLFYSITSSMRGFYQYSKHIYNSPDDEKAMNNYQGKVYGNKIASSLGSLACFTECKINPFIFPVLSLVSKKEDFDSAFTLLTIPNISWWRARMVGHINQECLTDFIKYIIHKPLSLVGIVRSEEVVEGIKKRKNLEINYIKERHYENLGIREKEEQTPRRFIKELQDKIKRSVRNNNVEDQLESAKKAGETIAPTLGLTAFLSTVIGFPLKVIYKQNIPINFFASLSLSFQQIIYFFKMVIPGIANIKKTWKTLQENDLDKRLKKEEIENLKLLLTEYKKLTAVGLLTFSSSIINSLLKLIKTENPYIEKLKTMIEGLSGDLVSKFFSERRHVLGFQFKAENPEFYDE